MAACRIDVCLSTFEFKQAPALRATCARSAAAHRHSRASIITTQQKEAPCHAPATMPATQHASRRGLQRPAGAASTPRSGVAPTCMPARGCTAPRSASRRAAVAARELAQGPAGGRVTTG